MTKTFLASVRSQVPFPRRLIPLLLVAWAVAIQLQDPARAYNHLWIGPTSGLWSTPENWTNNFPNPTENRAMRLFFPSLQDTKTTYQNVPGLQVDYLEVRGDYTVRGGPNAKLGFRNTNDSSMIVRVNSGGALTLAPDLEIALTNEISVWTPNAAGDPDGALAWFQGRVSGPGSLHVLNGGVELAGSVGNTYLGETVVSGGTLRLNKSNGLAVPGALTIGYGPGGGLSSTVKVLLFGDNQITPNDPINIHGAGWLDLNDHAQTLGDLTLRAGRLVTGTGTASLYGDVTSLAGNEPASLEGRLALGFVPRTFHVEGNSPTNGLEISAQISGSGTAPLIKSGPGTMTLSASNTFGGTVVLEGGVLRATGSRPLGLTSRGTIVRPGATLRVEQTYLADEPLTLEGDNLPNTSTLSVFGSTTASGPVTLTGEVGVSVWPTDTLAMTGIIAGSGGPSISGGTVLLGGDQPNTYTGETRVRFGTLELRKHLPIVGSSVGLTAVPGPLTIGPDAATARLFYPNEIADTSVVTLLGQGRLELNGRDETIGALSGSGGTVDLGSEELTLGGTVGTNTSSAVMAGAGGRLRKVGPSTQRFTGQNTLTGAMTIEGGALVLNGSQPNSPISVRTNGTLAGMGNVGVVSVLGGTVAPGDSLGRLSTRSIAFNSAATLRVELGGVVPGSNQDQLAVTGSVQLGGAHLVASLSFPGAPGTPFVILANDGVDPVVGTFAGLAEGQVFYVSSAPFRISYHGGDGNDVVLTQTGPLVPPQITGISVAPDGHPVIAGSGLAYYFYSVERSEDLVNWIGQDLIAADATGLLRYDDPDGLSLPHAFYRFIAVDDLGDE
jgi:autotransporter-associated beta strand protein